MANSKKDTLRQKTRKLFAAAAIFALLAGLGTMLYLKVLERRLEERLTPPQKEMVNVIVASRNLPVGTILNGSNMASRSVPRAYVNSDIFTPSDFDSIKGAILVKPLDSGKMLAHEYIDLKIPNDFSGTIQEGHRAITIQVDEINSISGMVKPGNFIDLYARIPMPKSSGIRSAGSREGVIPVLEDVLVLATDKISAKPNKDEFQYIQSTPRNHAYNTLTLEVTPRDAALIAIAQSKGELITTLRNANDTGGILFSKITLSDLLSHSGEMLENAVSKRHNKNLNGVHRNNKGQLVTRDGVVITDPNVHLNKNGLLVTKDGTVLSGRGLVIGADGRIRTKNGKLVDTATLTSGRNGTLIDKNGNVIAGNGYRTTKGGFLVDKDGQVLTPAGHILSGLTVGKDGQVRTGDGKKVTADQIVVEKDGVVRLKGTSSAPMTIDKDGNLRTADGKRVKTTDLVTVGTDGVVRSKDGTILKGVHLGKDGKLYNSAGKELSAADVLAATKGYTDNKDGTVTDADGKIRTAADLVTVDKNGVVRAKDGTILQGVYRDKNGKLRKKDGSLLTAQDVLAQKGGVNIGVDKLPRNIHLGRDGKFYNAAGKELSAADVLAASKGLTINKDGSVTDRNGKTLTAADLVTVGKDGIVRAKDGTILQGVYRSKNGKLRKKDGSLLTAGDVVSQDAIGMASRKMGTVLQGVRAKFDPAFADTIKKGLQKQLRTFSPYEVEYIIGGNSNGAAKTFTIQVDAAQSANKNK